MSGVYDIKVSTALDFLAVSASADRDGAILDMQGFDGVMMVVKMADIAAGATTSIKAQQDTDPAGGTMADLAGTGIAVADDDDNQIFIIDLYQPTERYVRVSVDKDAANATNECALYIQYGASARPVIQTVADEVTYERHNSPAEGVA
jgi:hypothetical protein